MQKMPRLVRRPVAPIMRRMAQWLSLGAATARARLLDGWAPAKVAQALAGAEVGYRSYEALHGESFSRRERGEHAHPAHFVEVPVARLKLFLDHLTPCLAEGDTSGSGSDGEDSSGSDGDSGRFAFDRPGCGKMHVLGLITRLYACTLCLGRAEDSEVQR